LNGLNSNFPAINLLNANSGTFAVIGGRSFTTLGNFTNTGSMILGGNSAFMVNGDYTQSGVASSLVLGDSLTRVTFGFQKAFLDGGTFRGNGTLQGSVTVTGSAQIIPGFSIGGITAQGNYVQTGGSIVFELARAGGVTSADLVHGTMTLSLSNTTLDFNLLPGSEALHEGDTFTVLTADGGLTLSGVTTVFEPSLNAYAFSVNNTGTSYILTTVPEPSARMMIVFGTIMLITLARRRMTNS
jgi:hypothetical protein